MSHVVANCFKKIWQILILRLSPDNYASLYNKGYCQSEMIGDEEQSDEIPQSGRGDWERKIITPTSIHFKH